MRREELYLADIVEAAAAIQGFLENVEFERFQASDLIRSAVLQKLTIVGEAVSRLPPAFRQRHPEVEWSDIAGFRNIAVHAYFAIDWRIVWVAATQEAQELAAIVANILSTEYPSSEQP